MCDHRIELLTQYCTCKLAERKIQAAITQFGSGEYCGLLHCGGDSPCYWAAPFLLRLCDTYLSTGAVLYVQFIWVSFLAYHTACCLSVTLCIVAKRYVLVSEPVKEKPPP